MATNYEQRKYEESQAVKNAQASLEAIAGQKPGAYQSQYQPQIQNLTDQILNRGQFQYDLNGDTLYNQYKDRYVGLGQQAMMDTMGQAAKLTGGYGNSYAQMAGQQAYHGYLQGLNDKVPELYQLALQRYNNEGQDLYNRYGLLSSQEEQAYNRFMNNYNMWNAERDWLAGRYDTERGFDYGGYRDAVADDQWKAGFDEDIRRFDFANKLGEFARSGSGGGGGGGGGRRQAPHTDLLDAQTQDQLFQQWYDEEVASQTSSNGDSSGPVFRLPQAGDQNLYRKYTSKLPLTQK